jgi:Uma2 family endonuclease
MATDTRDRSAEATEQGTVLRGIAWKTYLKLRDNPYNYRVRMSYLDGTLILMSPEYVHDGNGWRLAMVVSEVTEALRIPCLGTSTTTLRRKGDRPRKGSGKEPDQGFYIGENELRMRGMRDLDLDVDPPPDLAIEVDNKADSSKALTLYARLGVPEVWRYKARTKTLWFGRLVGDHYESIDRSLNLPRLTPDLVVQALGQADQMGQIDWKPWLRAWALELPEPPATA